MIIQIIKSYTTTKSQAKSHFSLQKPFVLWGEWNGSHNYYSEMNVMLGHRSGLLQTVGSRFIKKKKKLGGQVFNHHEAVSP